MFGKKKPEVMVVGAGPVGLFSAVSLAGKSIRVKIIDEGWRPAAHSYALALHPSSLKLLKASGLSTKVLESVHRINRVGIYDERERRATVDFSKLDTDFKYVGVLPQNRLEEALETVLRAHGIAVEWNHRLSRLHQNDGDHVEVSVDRMTMESLGYAVAHAEQVVASSREYEVPFLIGADGHGSLVRRSLGIDFEDAGQTRYFAVFEFKTDFDLQNEMRVVLAENTTSVLWTLAQGYCRWGFELTDFSAPPATREKDRFLIQREELPELSNENLANLIGSRAPWFTGRVEKLEWRTVVRFEQRLATLFGRDRSWLVGDAAHMALPVAVQSMNVGLTESEALAEALRQILRGQGSPDGLSEYGSGSLSRWRRLLGLEGERVTASSDASAWIRTNARRIAESIPASGGNRKRLLEQVGLSITFDEKPTHA